MLKSNCVGRLAIHLERTSQRTLICLLLSPRTICTTEERARAYPRTSPPHRTDSCLSVDSSIISPHHPIQITSARADEKVTSQTMSRDGPHRLDRTLLRWRCCLDDTRSQHARSQQYGGDQGPRTTIGRPWFESPVKMRVVRGEEARGRRYARASLSRWNWDEWGGWIVLSLAGWLAAERCRRWESSYMLQVEFSPPVSEQHAVMCTSCTHDPRNDCLATPSDDADEDQGNTDPDTSPMLERRRPGLRVDAGVAQVRSAA